MIIDFHTHIGESNDGSRQTLKELKRSMKKFGITKCVVFPIDEKKYSVEESSFRILDQTKGDKSFIPFFRFDPKKMTSSKLRDILKSFYGVKLHTRSQDFDPLNKKFFPLYREIANAEKPLLFHSKKYHVPQTDPMRLVKLARFKH